MASATIGDDVSTLYEFQWENDKTRTSDEIGDLEKAGFDFSLSEIVDVARDDPECEVKIIGFDNDNLRE